MSLRRARLLIALAAALVLSACPPREPAPKGGAQAPGSAEGEAKGPDPRSAFESSGFLGGLNASLESPVALVSASGVPEAGVALALGGALSTAAIARRQGSEHELVLASGARASLPGPVLALASSGDRIVVACAEPGSAGGSLIAFKAGGEGEVLTRAWKKDGPPARRILAVPGGRMAIADESGRLYLLDPSSGAELWGQLLKSPAADLAYAPGLVLAASGSRLEAFDESSGSSAWGAALTARARSIAAGNGVALVLAESGSLSAFSLIDGMGVGAAPGPFDPSLRPLAEGSRAIVAASGGGAAEIDVKSGQTLRAWSWEGAASFIAADRDRLFAGIDRRGQRGILVASRAGEATPLFSALDSPAFDAPLAVSGARGGLLLLLMDGSLVLLGKERARGSAASALEAAISPPPEAAAAISSALGRFKPGDSIEARRYLRFDLFTQGMPVEPEAAFTAFRFESATSARRSFSALPGGPGEVVAIYDETGRELAASIDELGSISSAAARLEKGRTYWIVAGWTFQATPTAFRLYLR
jgi:hypothetical protein